MKILRNFASNVCSWVLAIGYLLLLFAIGYLMLAWEAIAGLRKGNRAAPSSAPKARLERVTNQLPQLSSSPAATPAMNSRKAPAMTYDLPPSGETAITCKIIPFPVERTRRPRPLATSDLLVSARILFFPISRIVRRPAFGAGTNFPRY